MIIIIDFYSLFLSKLINLVYLLFLNIYVPNTKILFCKSYKIYIPIYVDSLENNIAIFNKQIENCHLQNIYRIFKLYFILS